MSVSRKQMQLRLKTFTTFTYVRTTGTLSLYIYTLKKSSLFFVGSLSISSAVRRRVSAITKTLFILTVLSHHTSSLLSPCKSSSRLQISF